MIGPELRKIKFIHLYYLLFFLTLNCNNNSVNETSYIDEFPFKSYELDDNGYVLSSEISSSDFQNSEDCAKCHPNHYNEWNISSHAKSNSSIFYHKRLADAVNDHGDDIENFCDQCHDPISIITNDYEINNTSHKGISCDVCHTMTRNSTPTIALPHQIVTSKLFLNPGEGVKYGSNENPNENNYHDSKFNPIFKQSESCLPCHDLRHEQLETEITYTEWSRIPSMAMSGSFSCQHCHMPKKEDGTHEHYFAGVDLSYEKLPEEEPLYNIVSELLKTAAKISFSSQIEVLSDSIYFNSLIDIPIKIESLNGHHLPSGTSFNRECWISIEIRENNENGDLLYTNGVLNSNIQLLNYYDSDLVYFTSFLLKENGDTTQDALMADEIINYSLPGLAVRYSNYQIELPENITSIWVKAKFNFRPIKPFIFDELPELKQNIPIYTIDEIEKNIYFIN